MHAGNNYNKIKLSVNFSTALTIIINDDNCCVIHCVPVCVTVTLNISVSSNMPSFTIEIGKQVVSDCEEPN